MKPMHILSRLGAAVLCLTLLFSQAAQALTPEQALALLEGYYVDQLPEAVYDQTTISEMLSVLGDPYTQYFTPEEYNSFTASMSDTKLVGIGVVYTTQENGLLLSEVLPGSPAEAGGLKAGDVIVTVDGHSTKGVTSQESSGWIQGEEGTKVRITYLRGKNRTTVSLPRATVVVPATTAELIDDHIGYIRCTTFGDETVEHFEDAIQTYGEQVTCWVIDLRDNAGGITEAATEAAGLFTGPGKMTYFRDGADTYSVFQHEEEAATILPVIVLINENSASSTEIFAAAIQGSESGIIIGNRSFGKGVAQTVWDKNILPPYFPEGDAIKITTYRFFSILGNTTDQVGVLPDIMAPPTLALDLAWLLAGSARGPHVEHPLRIDLGYGHPWRWYVDLDVAVAEENKDLFSILLDVLPPETDLWTQEDKGDWQTVSLKELCETYALTSYADSSFPDLDTSICPEALSGLQYYGLIRGKDDGAYHPQDNLTRGELCQLLAAALNCSVPQNISPYSDVAEDAWYAPAVKAMTNMGLVNGVGNGQFQPDAPIDHQQFLTIMGRLAQWLNMGFYSYAANMPPEALTSETLAEYGEWARPSVWLLAESQTDFIGRPLSLLWEDLPNISPSEATTRDEAAFILYSILIYTGVLP